MIDLIVPFFGHWPCKERGRRSRTFSPGQLDRARHRELIARWTLGSESTRPDTEIHPSNWPQPCFPLVRKVVSRVLLSVAFFAHGGYAIIIIEADRYVLALQRGNSGGGGEDGHCRGSDLRAKAVVCSGPSLSVFETPRLKLLKATEALILQSRVQLG